MGTLLQLSELRTHFYTDRGVVRAVDGVSYHVDAGETLSIVGESGCGKSVSALSIMRLIPSPPGRIVGGRILFHGEDLLEKGEEAMRAIRGHRIAMIFQEPMTSLNPVLTIGRQMTEAMEIHLGMSNHQARRRAAELLALTQIPDPERRLAQYPHQFSGGMRQRVMLAMALSCNPQLILADEPTTALDVTVQAQILDLMQDLCRQFNVAVVIITHNLGVVARYADRVCVMYAGKVVEQGEATELFCNPRHPYTLGLMNSVSRLDRPRQDRLASIPGQPPDLARLDAGCSYRPRCPYAVARCAAEAPELAPVGDGHLAACWMSDRLARETAGLGSGSE